MLFLRILFLLILIKAGFSYFLSSNRIDPERDRFVTVQEYYNQIKCTKGCEQNCYNFMAYRWDEMSTNCYECIGNCSQKVAPAKLKFKPPSILRDASVCCPSYELYYATVSVSFEVSDRNILKEAYIVWEYRMSRGVNDFAPSPWMTILQTRATRATIEGLMRDVSFQFRANLVDGMGDVERLLTDWIDILDFPATNPPTLASGQTTTSPSTRSTKPVSRSSLPTLITTTPLPITTTQIITPKKIEIKEISENQKTTTMSFSKLKPIKEEPIGKKVDPNMGLFKRA